MESTQNLKKRIKSVANINKITKAMELVAATKMRRAQEIALASRPYAFVALDLLANLTLMEKSKHLPVPELLKQRKVKKVLFVLVSSDKGLAGAFNGLVFKKFEKYISEKHSDILQNIRMSDYGFVAVGEKSANYLSKKGFNVIKKFVSVGDFTTVEQVQPLTDFIVDGYLKKPATGGASPATGGASWDKVIIFSTHFTSALKQEPFMREVLPISFESIRDIVKEITPTTGKFAELIKEQNLQFTRDISNEPHKRMREYLIEPSPKVVLENLTKHLFFMQIYHLILEANASEHSARRMAMKTASDNASELGENLNLQYNKVRQANITKEIIEIVAGSEALQ